MASPFDAVIRKLQVGTCSVASPSQAFRLRAGNYSMFQNSVYDVLSLKLTINN